LILSTVNSIAHLLRAKDIQNIFGMSKEWVYNNVRELGGFRIGRSWFFTQEGVQDAIQRGQEMAGCGNSQRQKNNTLVRYKKSSGSMGDRRTGGTVEREKARHGLINFV